MRRKIRFITAIMVIICTMLCLGTPAFAAAGKTVRVGWYTMSGLQDMDSDGNPSGYNYGNSLARSC